MREKKKKERMMVVGKISPHLLGLIEEEWRSRKMGGLIYAPDLSKKMRIRKINFILCTKAFYKTNKKRMEKMAKKVPLRILVKEKEDLCKLELGENISGVFFDYKLKAMIDINYAHILSTPPKNNHAEL